MAKNRFKLIPAVYLILRRGDKVLLLKRANSGYQDGKYSVIAGHLEGDELATDAVAREAREEAGITIDPKNLELAHVCHRLTRNEAGQERLDLFFEAKTWNGKIVNKEPRKCTDLNWFPLDTLPDEMIPLVRSVLEGIARGSSYSEYTEEPT